MNDTNILEDFLKYAAFGEMQQPIESGAVKSNLADYPVASGQPPVRPTLITTTPVNPAGNTPAVAPVKPATNPNNFKIK